MRQGLPKVQSALEADGFIFQPLAPSSTLVTLGTLILVYHWSTQKFPGAHSEFRRKFKKINLIFKAYFLPSSLLQPRGTQGALESTLLIVILTSICGSPPCTLVPGSGPFSFTRPCRGTPFSNESFSLPIVCSVISLAFLYLIHLGSYLNTVKFLLPAYWQNLIFKHKEEVQKLCFQKVI